MTVINPTLNVVAGTGTGSSGPNPPIIISLTEASQIMLVGVVQSAITGAFPVAAYNLYRSTDGVSYENVANKQIQNWVLQTLVFDDAPVFGARAYYYATAVDTQGNESEPSNITYYTAQETLTGIIEMRRLSAAAFGSYPLLGSDVYIDPLTGEGVIGANGDLLTVTGLSCLAQDLRLRILTEPGELFLHPNYGFGKASVIGSGQASPQVQAQILRADIVDVLNAEPRVNAILAVEIDQSSSDSWIISYDVMAIGVEDAQNFNIVYPYFLTGGS